MSHSKTIVFILILTSVCLTMASPWDAFMMPRTSLGSLGRGEYKGFGGILPMKNGDELMGASSSERMLMPEIPQRNRFPNSDSISYDQRFLETQDRYHNSYPQLPDRYNRKNRDQYPQLPDRHIRNPYSLSDSRSSPDFYRGNYPESFRRGPSF